MKLNTGDWIYFSAFGMYITSMFMGWSINDYTFAEEIIVPLVVLALSGVGYSHYIHKEQVKPKRKQTKQRGKDW